MRVLLGLAALAATANAALVVTPQGSNTAAAAGNPAVGETGLSTIQIRLDSASGALATVSPSIPAPPTLINSLNWVVTTLPTTQSLAFLFGTNSLTGQIQYRWFPDYNPVPAGGANTQSYTCDPCAGGTPSTCNTATGPGASPSPASGYLCANLARTYLMTGLVQSHPNEQKPNSFSVQLFDLQKAPAPNASSYSFQVIRPPPAVIVGDPQIVGMQGQDFQVHGMPDEIFNIISSPEVQVNARFTYLESAACHDNYTACFAHPGTYITEEGFRIGSEKLRVTAGSYKKGLTVHVNGKKINQDMELKNNVGSVQIVNHRRAIVTTPKVRIIITNSDKFMNQEMAMLDQDLIKLGAKRTVLKDNQRFHPEVPMHGLQGQTWRNVEYPSGLEYEGSIMDYHVVSGNIYGTDFVFNHFKAQ